MTRCVVEAVKAAGVHAVVSKGWSDRLRATKLTPEEEAAEAERQPREIFNIKSAPHDWLFSQVDAACHHGGAGTTGASLRGSCSVLRDCFGPADFYFVAGIPTIIHPFFGDQLWVVSSTFDHNHG